jgi:hypothetical protein
MAFFSPSSGSRYALHLYDLVLDLDAIERGDIEDGVTPDLLDAYDPVWWMHALELLSRIRDAVEEEIVRCISDARIDHELGEGDPDEFVFAIPTWEEIGRRLGVSAQAAHQRYGKRLRPHSVTGEISPIRTKPARELAPRHPAGTEVV